MTTVEQEATEVLRRILAEIEAGRITASPGQRDRLRQAVAALTRASDF